jgi:hypothetical protein
LINGFVGCPFCSFTVPKSVETIGPQGFHECTDLAILNFPEDGRVREVRGFSGTSLTSVSLPSSLEVLSAEAFALCNLLTTVAFSAVPRITILSGFQRCARLAFSESNGFLNFAGWPTLRTVTGFNACPIAAVEFPETIEEISGFNGCSQLETVVFPRSGKLANITGFSDTPVRTVTFPRSVGMINAFSSCGQLEHVELPDIELQVLDGFMQLSMMTDIVIPACVQKLDRGAFLECPKLTVVFFVTDSCLREITGLCSIPIASIAIPDSVENIIGLLNCTKLESVTFGENSRIHSIAGLRGCAFREICLPASLRELFQGALVSRHFRVMCLGANSQLTSHRRLGNYFFVSAGERWLSWRRRAIHSALSNRTGPQHSSIFKL